jgi:hypothetical protein
MTNRPSLLPIARAVVGALAFTLASAGIAGAQTNEPMSTDQAPAAPITPPTYATPIAGESISGHIAAITGKYTLQVRDSRGFIDNVTLHPGTIINPRGLTLAPGMQVTINGSNAGASFTANQIDAPYTVALVPGYGYGYGPGYGSIGLGFGGWGWGSRFRGGFFW